jgi:hypothetical protein
MKLKVSLVIGVITVALAAVLAVVVPSAQAKTGGSYTLPNAPYTGTATGDTVTNAAASATTITITQFKVINGVINAVGTFTGTVAGVNGDQPFTANFTAPVSGSGLPLSGASTSAAAANGTCPVLSLTLGPLHLDLLGLVVDLNQVNLNITAQSGPGNLLGNLLCSVAGLLDNTGSGGTGGLSGLLQSITNLLNQILAQL